MSRQVKTFENVSWWIYVKLQLTIQLKYLTKRFIKILIKLLGLTIDNKLNFDYRINCLRKVGSTKLKVLGRFQNRIDVS